jgi:DNA-binding NarL/FixJ family response regulator
LSPDLTRRIYENRVARAFTASAEAWELIADAIAICADRLRAKHTSPTMRVDLGERAIYVRLMVSEEATPCNIAIVREERLRDPTLFRRLNERHQITRRQYQIISALRAGKSGREIALDLELSPGTIKRHVHRILEQLNVRNRVHLVALIEELSRRPA